ncbi:MAG: hypothetical protein M3O30_05525 [Planctomycetota bacterium]|nr:hypothetical protein [Planctomycetota bacterium]
MPPRSLWHRYLESKIPLFSLVVTTVAIGLTYQTIVAAFDSYTGKQATDINIVMRRIYLILGCAVISIVMEMILKRRHRRFLIRQAAPVLPPS